MLKNKTAKQRLASAQAYDERQAQMTMDAFLSFNQRFAKIRSKRLQKAVKGISKMDNPEIMMDEAELPLLKPSKPLQKKGGPSAGVCLSLLCRFLSAPTETHHPSSFLSFLRVTSRRSNKCKIIIES